MQTEPRVDVLDVRLRIDDRLTRSDDPNRLFFALVVLVADLADDLLEQVLHRREARRAAVLVDHDRERELPALHLAQQLRDALGFRNERYRAHQRA